VALCLSSGGYRAALFHLGAVRALNELGVVGAIDTITSVSGGSILAAFLAHRVGNEWPTQQGERIADFDSLANRFHELCATDIRTGPLLAGTLTRWLPQNWDGHVAVRKLEGEYREHIGTNRLVDLPERPNFVFCATDMTYGVHWTFTRQLVGSYMAGWAPTPPVWPIARAAAASSCFPPFFNPMPIGLDPEAFSVEGADRSPERAVRIRGLRLSDGGLDDNMGLEPVWKSHAVLLVSEGGSTFDASGDRGQLWRLNRYVEVMGRQGGAQRKRWLISNFIEEVFRGAYWGIGTEIDDYESGMAGYPPSLTKSVIAEIRTDLDEFSFAERYVLENHGYLLTQAAIRRYASFLADDPPPPVSPPHPDWLDEDEVRRALANSHKRKIP
jgi:NTE family protein